MDSLRVYHGIPWYTVYIRIPHFQTDRRSHVAIETAAQPALSALLPDLRSRWSWDPGTMFLQTLFGDVLSTWPFNLQKEVRIISFLSYSHVLRNPACWGHLWTLRSSGRNSATSNPQNTWHLEARRNFSSHPSSRRRRQHEETRRSRRWTRSPHCSDPTCQQTQLFTIKNVPLLDPSLLMNDLRSNQRMNFPTWTQAESNMHVDVLCVPASHLKALELSENCWRYAWNSCHFVDSMRGKVANHNLYDLDQFMYIYIYIDI